MKYKTLLLSVLFLPAILAFDDLGIVPQPPNPNDHLTCDGPFKFNGYPSDLRLSGSLGTGALAGLTALSAQSAGMPEVPIDPEKLTHCDVSKPFGLCGLVYKKEFASGKGVTSPPDNCGKANARGGVRLEFECDSSTRVLETKLAHHFKGFGIGNIEDSCCSNPPAPIAVLATSAASELYGGTTFVITAENIEAFLELKLTCPLGNSNSEAHYAAELKVDLLRMGSDGSFIPYNPPSIFEGVVTETLIVNSDPESGNSNTATNGTDKVTLIAGVYRLNYTHSATGVAGKEIKCPADPTTPLGASGAMNQEGKIVAEIALISFPVTEQTDEDR